MRLEFKDAKSNKFWEAKLSGKSFEARWGYRYVSVSE